MDLDEIGRIISRGDKYVVRARVDGDLLKISVHQFTDREEMPRGYILGGNRMHFQIRNGRP